VVELKRDGQEKRARRILTRPEPTIIGNCDSWNFIVGKTVQKQSEKNCTLASLQLSNSYFIHRLST